MFHFASLLTSIFLSYLRKADRVALWNSMSMCVRNLASQGMHPPCHPRLQQRAFEIGTLQKVLRINPQHPSTASRKTQDPTPYRPKTQTSAPRTCQCLESNGPRTPQQLYVMVLGLRAKDWGQGFWLVCWGMLCFPLLGFGLGDVGFGGFRLWGQGLGLGVCAGGFGLGA